jgi:hypothetical protein
MPTLQERTFSIYYIITILTFDLQQCPSHNALQSLPQFWMMKPTMSAQEGELEYGTRGKFLRFLFKLPSVIFLVGQMLEMLLKASPAVV